MRFSTLFQGRPTPHRIHSTSPAQATFHSSKRYNLHSSNQNALATFIRAKRCCFRLGFLGCPGYPPGARRQLWPAHGEQNLQTATLCFRQNGRPRSVQHQSPAVRLCAHRQFRTLVRRTHRITPVVPPPFEGIVGGTSYLRLWKSRSSTRRVVSHRLRRSSRLW